MNSESSLTNSVKLDLPEKKSPKESAKDILSGMKSKVSIADLATRLQQQKEKERAVVNLLLKNNRRNWLRILQISEKIENDLLVQKKN